MKLKKNILGTIRWRGLYFVTMLLLNIIVARYFKATGSGWLYYIINYLSFVILIGSCSLESGITFFASGNVIKPVKLAGFALLWTAVVSILITLLFFLYYKQPLEGISRKEFIFFAGFYISGILLTTFFSALFYAQQDFKLPNVLLIVTNLLLIIAAPVVVAFSKEYEAPGIFLQLYFINFLLQGIAVAGGYLIKNKFLSVLALPALSEIKILFRYAFFALAANLVFFLLYRIDYWFIKNDCPVCNPDDLGNYIQASRLGQLFLVVPAMIANVLFPGTASGFKAEINNLLPVLSRTVLFFYLLLLLILVLAGKWLFPFVFGETFDNMYLPFLLLMPGILALSSVAFVSAYYAGKNKVIVNLKASSLALVLVIAGDICFIPYFGIMAAAVVSSVAYLTCYFYILMAFRKDYAVPVKHFFIPAGGDFKKVYTYVLQQFRGI